MRIGGLQKFSLIDFPGKMAAVVFTQGCNFRCGYCHNPQLVLADRFQKLIPEEEVFDFLKRRQGTLEGVVVTGGEPTLQKALMPFLRRIKGFNFAVKLDTNGSHPLVLERIVKERLVDYIAMDVKAPLADYEKVAVAKVAAADIQKSIQLIVESGIPYEFRTTLIKALCPESKIPELFAAIPQARRYILQPFIASKEILDEKLLSEEHYSPVEIATLKTRWERDSYR